MVPTDVVKYELDKDSGLLRVDRPQKYSNGVPTLYGFLPRSFCGGEIAKRCMAQTGLKDIEGDGDPLDVCVLTERPINHGNFLCTARPIGGLRMVDGSEADDKIIAVLKNDSVFGELRELDQLPSSVVDRLRHYFLTYKQGPDAKKASTSIPEIYGREEALEVCRLSFRDYTRLVKS